MTLTNDTSSEDKLAVLSTRNVVICGVAAFITIVVIVLVALTTTLKKPTKIILLNLLVIDMVVMLNGLVYALLAQTEVDSSHGLCAATVFVWISGFSMSRASVAGIAFNHFIALFYPFKHPLMITTKSVSITVIVTWVILSILCSTSIVGPTPAPGEPCIVLAYIPCHSSILTSFLLFTFDIIVIAMTASICIALRKRRRVNVNMMNLPGSKNDDDNHNLADGTRGMSSASRRQRRSLKVLPQRRSQLDLAMASKMTIGDEVEVEDECRVSCNTVSVDSTTDDLQCDQNETFHVFHNHQNNGKIEFKHCHRTNNDSLPEEREQRFSSRPGDESQRGPSSSKGKFPILDAVAKLGAVEETRESGFNSPGCNVQKLSNRFKTTDTPIYRGMSKIQIVNIRKASVKIVRTQAAAPPVLPRAAVRSNARRNQFHRLSVSMIIVSTWCCVFNLPCDLYLFYMAFFVEDRFEASMSLLGMIFTTLLLANVLGDPFIYAWRFVRWRRLVDKLKEFWFS